MGESSARPNVLLTSPDPTRFEPLSGFSPEQAELFRSKLVQQQISAGEVFIRAGDDGDCLFIIHEGKVEVRSPDRGDGSQKALATLGPGSVVGEMALLNREPRNADVVALTDCQVHRLSASDYADICSKLPSLKLFLTRLVAHRLSWSGADVLARRVGDCTVMSRLGEGGMGWVFRGVRDESAEGIQQQVAIKMLPHTMVQRTGFLEKFREEANVMSRVRHENIVTLFETIDAYGTMFMILEFVPGCTIREWVIRHGRPSVDDVRRVAKAAIRALSAAHKMSIIHRDVKPDNFMLREDGVVKLMDFGIAVPITGPVISLGGVSLTPVYAAPELFYGDRGEPSADFYSLGIMLYELLANRPPFTASSFEEWAHEHVHSVPPPLGYWCNEVPADLEEFINAALTKDVPSRVAALKPLLARFADSRASSSTPSGLIQSLPRMTPRAVTGTPASSVSASSENATAPAARIPTAPAPPVAAPPPAAKFPSVSVAKAPSVSPTAAAAPAVKVVSKAAPAASAPPVAPASPARPSVAVAAAKATSVPDASAAPKVVRAPTVTVKAIPPQAPAAVPSPADRRIIALWLKLQGQEKEHAYLMSKPLVIGRDEPADIIIPDETLSRRHIELKGTAEGIVVRDLGSSNGSFVNDEPIQEKALSKNDQLRIGYTLLTIVGESPTGIHMMAQPVQQ